MRLVMELIMSDRLVTIAQFTDSIKANMAKQLLADHEIESFLAGEHATNLYKISSIAVMELQTLESKAKQAVEILESQNKEEQ